MARAQRPHDVLATVGTYKDRHSGEEKKRRLKVGAASTICYQSATGPPGQPWNADGSR